MADRGSVGTVLAVPNTIKTECRPSPIHGRGVFATAPVLAGELLDFGPLMALPSEEIGGTLLGWYVFEHTEEESLLCLGRTSMMNHSCSPNAEVEVNAESLDYRVFALCNIMPGTEILIDYGPDYGLVDLED